MKAMNRRAFFYDFKNACKQQRICKTQKRNEETLKMKTTDPFKHRWNDLTMYWKGILIKYKLLIFTEGQPKSLSNT